jgi:hypothetical protein
MADAGDLTVVGGTRAEAAPQLVELSAARVHPRASAGGVLPARIARYRRMANVSADHPDCAVCGELQSGLNRRLLNLT